MSGLFLNLRPLNFGETIMRSMSLYFLQVPVAPDPKKIILFIWISFETFFLKFSSFFIRVVF